MEQVQRTSRSASAETQARYRSNFVAKLDLMAERLDELVVAVSALVRENRELEKQRREARK
jgi:hypothetical protein